MPTTINFVASNALLAPHVTYDELIGGDPLTLAFMTAKASKVTVSGGRVVNMIDRSAYGYLASQSDAGKRPAWEENGGPSGRSGCLVFDNARQDQLATNVVVPVGSGACWTKAAVIKVPAEPTANQYHDIMSGSNVPTSVLGAHRFAVRGTNLFAGVIGTTAATVSRTTPQIADAWCLAMCSWHGPSNTVALSVNGGAWTTATVAGAQCTDPVLNIGAVGGISGTGATFVGRIADCALFSVSMHNDTSPSVLNLLARYKEYIFNAHDLALN